MSDPAIGSRTRIGSEGVVLDCSIVPWDTELLGRPVAAIERIAVPAGAPAAAIRQAVADLHGWLDGEAVAFASCRLPSLDLPASMLLEEAGFRFIETVYDPVLDPVPDRPAAATGIVVRAARPEDLPALEAIAGVAFTTGRHALDHRLDPGFAGRRYRRWLVTSLDDPRREVLAALEGDAIVGLFVVEALPERIVRWQLTAIAPEAQGRGVGRRVWGAMIERHRAAGAARIETTVSGHNLPVLALYAALGFRLTAPRTTFHWIRP